MSAADNASGMYKTSSSSTTAEDLSDKKVQVRRSATTDTTNSNDSLSVTADRGSNLSLRKSSSGGNHHNNNNNNSSNPPTPPSAAPYLECDYDLNPTVLYQAIEAKQWEYAISVFTKHEQEDQSSTWVVRKETNGKLRWRLLPLHAAVLFGSPLSLIELLLADYPAAAHSKDDQGMLPLHLAFRNESQWDVIEELLTAYPAAVFISDRKGRTPLQCGIRQSQYTSSAASTITSSTASAPKTKSNNKSTSSAIATTIVRTNTGLSDTGTVAVATTAGPSNKAAFRAVVNILDVYSQIAISGERQRAEQEARTLANASITQLKDSHMKTLAALKAEWEKQQAESQRQRNDLVQHNASLEERVKELEQELAKKNQEERRMQARYRRMEVALKDAEERYANSKNNNNNSKPAMQDRRQELLTHVKEMVAERDQMRSLFLKDHPLIADEQQEKDLSLIQDLEQMMRIDSPSHLQQSSLGTAEEKKVDDPAVPPAATWQNANR
jgi:Ankyrin repeats (many copies)